MKRLTTTSVLVLLAVAGLDTFVLLIDRKSWVRLFEKVEHDTNPTETPTFRKVSDSSAKFHVMTKWVAKRKDVERAKVLGISDTIFIENVVTLKSVISRSSYGYSCGPLCGYGEDRYYLYFFGCWIKILYIPTWVA